ncbi:MAG TPA: hypothetical protein VLD85_11680 [Anaeromyxobacteraceae bacterium]|nr:hypothetical protein [Anaeromyxobacteraceae bacterium]
MAETATRRDAGRLLPEVGCWAREGPGAPRAGPEPGEGRARHRPALTREDLRLCQRELEPLAPREAAAAGAREAARAFNADASRARSELLEPALALLESGEAIPAQAAGCILRKVAELAFWRRVLCSAYPGDLDTAATPPDWLLRYLLS